MGLTPKQEAFVAAYQSCRNFDQAMTAAGLSCPSAATGYYVYFLIDGSSGEVFYVGKGKGKRMLHHRAEAFKDATKNRNGVKAERIRRAGESLREVVFLCDLNEIDALSIEKNLIAALRDHGLTNIASGSVHPIESLLAEARGLLDYMAPHNVWVANANPRVIEACTRIWGSPLAAREALIAEVRETIEILEREAEDIKRKSSESRR